MSIVNICKLFYNNNYIHKCTTNAYKYLSYQGATNSRPTKMKGKELGGGDTKTAGSSQKTKTENAKKVETLREIEQMEQK